MVSYSTRNITELCHTLTQSAVVIVRSNAVLIMA